MSKQQTWVYGTEQYEKAKGCPEHKKRKYNPFLRKSGSLCKGCVSFQSMMMQCLFIVMETFRFQPLWPYFFKRRNFPFKKIGNESVFAENIFYAFLFYLETIFKNWTSMTSLVAFSNFNQLAKYIQSSYLGIWTKFISWKGTNQSSRNYTRVIVTQPP